MYVYMYIVYGSQIFVTYITELESQSNVVDDGHDVIDWRLVRVPDQTKTH